MKRLNVAAAFYQLFLAAFVSSGGPFRADYAPRSTGERRRKPRSSKADVWTPCHGRGGSLNCRRVVGAAPR